MENMIRILPLPRVLLLVYGDAAYGTGKWHQHPRIFVALPLNHTRIYRSCSKPQVGYVEAGIDYGL
jgi:hypothetical protein